MDILARFFLFFDNGPFILLLLATGLIFGNRTLFYQATCIMLISIILNVALKCTFQISIAPNTDFVFPSGHMQLAAVLYGWIGLHIKNHTVQALIICLLAGIGFGLVHFEYHSWTDVFGAIFFAGIILSLYHVILRKQKQHLIWIYPSITTLAMIYIAYQDIIPSHAWVAYSVLLSFIIIVPKKICAQSRI
ncbi:MAG: phosphatase PAP2 family protein [Legionellaceae bacterium]|nr:phosphatase PAP2 family protein [Legionellaceae bacterium]